MNTKSTRTCIKCGAPCRFLLCDDDYAKTPHCDEPIAVTRHESSSFSAGLPVRVDGVWSVA
jgi:hypothetical protein